MSATPRLVFQRQQSSRSTEKPVVPPPLQATPSLAPGPAVPAPGPVQLLMLGPASGAPEAPATVFLTPLSLPPAPAGLRPRASAQHPRAGLGAALGALQRRVRRLQRRHEQHQARLRALEQAAGAAATGAGALGPAVCGECPAWPTQPRCFRLESRVEKSQRITRFPNCCHEKNQSGNAKQLWAETE